MQIAIIETTTLAMLWENVVSEDRVPYFHMVASMFLAWRPEPVFFDVW